MIKWKLGRICVAFSEYPNFKKFIRGYDPFELDLLLFLLYWLPLLPIIKFVCLEYFVQSKKKILRNLRNREYEARSKAPLNTKLTLMDCGIGNTNLLGSSSSGMIAFTWNQQMVPQCISIWGVALEVGDFKLIIEWN